MRVFSLRLNPSQNMRSSAWIECESLAQRKSEAFDRVHRSHALFMLLLVLVPFSTQRTEHKHDGRRWSPSPPIHMRLSICFESLRISRRCESIPMCIVWAWRGLGWSNPTVWLISRMPGPLQRCSPVRAFEKGRDRFRSGGDTDA